MCTDIESISGNYGCDAAFRNVYMLGEQISAHPSFEISMDNCTAVPLQGKALLINQLKLLTYTTVAGTLYGIAFVLFCLYVHSIVPRFHEEDRKRQAKFMLAYSTVIMICGLYNLVATAWDVQDAYIEHSNSIEGPDLYMELTFHTTPAIAIALTCQLAVDALTSAIQVHSYFSPIYPTSLLNSDQGLACMGHLECHPVRPCGHLAALTVFLDFHG
jgi:hypothetical protein